LEAGEDNREDDGERHEPVFHAITSPQLLSFGQDTIRSYLMKREAYLRQIKEAHDANVKPATVLSSSIDPNLLENAVIMGLFLGERRLGGEGDRRRCGRLPEDHARMLFVLDW
jgi:hypothetical protein